MKTHSIRQDILDTALRNSQKQTDVAPLKKDSSSLPQPVLKETNKLTPVGNNLAEEVMLNQFKQYKSDNPFIRHCDNQSDSESIGASSSSMSIEKKDKQIIQDDALPDDNDL